MTNKRTIKNVKIISKRECKYLSRNLIKPINSSFEISENTLNMMDKSMENFKKGKISKSIEL